MQWKSHLKIVRLLRKLVHQGIQVKNLPPYFGLDVYFVFSMLQTTTLWMEREAREATGLKPEAVLEGVVTRGENQKLFLFS
jgi:hypothetical protein